MKRILCSSVLVLLLALWGCSGDRPLQPEAEAPPQPAHLTLSSAVAATCELPPCAPGFGGGGSFAPSPFTGTVVFSGNRGVYGSLESVFSASSGGHQKLAGPDSFEDPDYSAAVPPYTAFSRSPAWSPDGSHVAFESTRNGAFVDRQVFYALSADVRVEITEAEYDEAVTDWSIYDYVNDNDLFDVAGSMRSSVDEDGDGLFSEDWFDGVDNDSDGRVDEDWIIVREGRPPQLTPDGTEVIQVATGDPNIWLIDADGTNLEQVTTDPGYDGSPAWSPDGTQLAFFSDRDGSVAVWVHDLSTGEERRVFQVGTGSPESFYGFPMLSWSPDATRLAWGDPDGELSAGSAGVIVASASGDGSYNSFGVAGDNPAWSPDGWQLAVGLQLQEGSETAPDGTEIPIVVPHVGLMDATTGELLVVLRRASSCPCGWTEAGLVVVAADGSGIQHIDLQGNLVSGLSLSASGLPGTIDRLSWKP